MREKTEGYDISLFYNPIGKLVVLMDITLKPFGTFYITFSLDQRSCPRLP